MSIAPISTKSKLSGTPTSAPKYSTEVQDANGNAVALGDPNVTRGLTAIMNVHAVVGGAACHWGGPAAFAEIMSSVHGIIFATKNRQWHEAYNFLNDAGHAENGIYALRANLGFDNMTFESICGFRSIQSKFTGHGESHINPEGVLFSNGPLGSSLPQAQGIAMADKVAGNDRTTICVISDGASMEGEAKESFSAIPGFAAKGMCNPFVMIVSDNNTKLSGRIDEDSYSMTDTFASMENLGWSVINVSNGNDLQSTYTAIEKAVAAAKTNPNKPVCVICKTVKGYGIKATEESSSGGHGFPLKNGEKIMDWLEEIFPNDVPSEITALAQKLVDDFNVPKEASSTASTSTVKSEKAQAGFARAAIKAATDGYPLMSISADLAGSTGMKAFQDAFPDQAIDIGIAESNMVSTAAGFSKAGFIPIVDTFAQFGVTKGSLPLTMAALSQSPIIAVFSHAGFQDAADGASHQATTYISTISAIPHTQVVQVACSAEADAYLYDAVKRMAEAKKNGEDGESVIFFVGRENFPEYFDANADYSWGKAQLLREGSDAVIVASGPETPKALEAAEILAGKGKSIAVINNPFINNVDIELIGKMVKNAGGKIVTAEDHQVKCGMGAQVAHALGQAGIHFNMASVGMQAEFGQSAYLANELYDKYGMGTSGIVESIESLF